MKISITNIAGLCLRIEQADRRDIKIWWLGKWWGRCGFCDGRDFYRAETKSYHHGWTRTKRTWIGPIMVDYSKSLTLEEKENTYDAEL